MNIQKIIASKNVTKLTAVLGVGALGTTKLINDVSEEKTYNYMDKTPTAMYNKSQVLYQRDDSGFREGESVAEFLARMKKGIEIGVLTRYSDPEESKLDWEDIQSTEIIKYKTEAELEASLNKVKNPKLKNIIKLCFENNILYKNMVDFVAEMEIKSSNINDPVILKFLNDIYDEILKVKFDENSDDCEFDFVPIDISNSLETADKVIDSYNTIKGNYSQIVSMSSFDGIGDNFYEKSSTKEYLETDLKIIEENTDDDDDISLKSRLQEYQRTNGEFYDQETIDFIWKQKSEVFESIIRNCKIKNYLYELYLKELTIPSQAKSMCKEILDKYGVMLLPSMFSMDFEKEFEYIQNELEAWEIASNGKATFPETINLNVINPAFLKNAGGLHSAFNSTIAIKTGYLKNIVYALRHELMHENDSLKGAFRNIGEERVELLNEIMPTKVVNGRKVRDYKNCKYKEEFLKIGVNPQHIDYAYTNRTEFLAVAAEGDLSKCSDEFKEVLIKLGMPEYVFNLKVINPKIKENCHKVERFLEKYPHTNDYGTIIKYLKMNEINQKKQTFRLLLELMKDNDIQE